MPAIRKIRIVNFRFNDGAKLIPDEIFCTENAEGKPIDTLLNLDNGGGKSVIVQLLLQPVCPKAKVQNRNISDYFQKGTDHAFVLIEWSLDGSSNSLLTGISLAASTTADDENESKTVRFYTFMHDYTRTGDKLDLINLPLTERTGSHIRPMSYDDLRKYLQNRKVDYYSSESADQRRYHKRLEEYGILHTEWENILVRINAVEGGITKFFEEYRTADRLLDKFIIPGVMPNDTVSAEELEDMFVHYAESYAGQEENLRLQSQIKSFTEKLQGILPFMKNMWDAEDARIQAIRLLADHLFTLDHHIKVESDKQAQLEQTIADLKAKLHHIKAEKASEIYYLAQESFDKASTELEECRQQKEDAENQRDKFAHLVNVLNAAKEYAELLDLQNDEKALTAQIRDLEQGTQDSRILSLKYSLSLISAELRQQTESNLYQEGSTRKEQSDALCKVKEKIEQLTTQLNDRNVSLNQTIGSKNIMLEQINQGLSEIALHITLMLDESYSKEDIVNIRSCYDKKIKNANDEIERCQNEAEQLGLELDDQDTERTELTQAQANFNVRLQQYETAMEQYRKAYNAVLPVLEHLSISAIRLFTDEPITSLDNILANLTEHQRQTEHSAELLAEQLRCIEAGQLHLSKTAVDFLQESGVSFQTGEQYLIFQSPKIREDILAVNPLVAYAVIVDSKKEQIKLLSQTTDQWLSAVVPVYSRSELADMADGNWSEHNRFLSAFDKEYFSDASAYKDVIQQRLDDAKAEIEHIKRQIREWESERSILVAFTYTADDEKRIQKQITSCQSELHEIQDKLSALDKRKEEIKKRTKELHGLINAEQHVLRQTENQQKEFERICGTISQYEELSRQITDMESACKRLATQIESEQREESRISELIAECDEKIKQLNDKLTEYQNLLAELKDTPESEVLSEDYSAMIAEYRMYQENYSSNLQELHRQLQKAHEGIKKKAKDIERFHIEPAEYEKTVYSDDAYQRTEKQLSQAQIEHNQAFEQHSAAVECHAKAESALEQAKAKLSELHTELLPRSEVGSDFEHRITECRSALDDSEKNKQECTDKLNELNADRKYTAKYAERFTVEYSDYTPKLSVVLQDTDKLRDTIENCIDKLEQAESQSKKYHSTELEPFRNTHTLFTGTLDGILSVIDNHDIAGDKYFTLYERTEGDIRRYHDRIAQLAVLLKDVEDSRNQLVTNCLQRVGRLYENLAILSKKSTIQIGNTKKQMIRIDLPVIDPMSEQPAERINQYITEQVKKYLSEQDTSAKSHHEHLAIRRLLNCYIGKETIPITVFKIDKNVQNSRYRSWQDALKANSGGEQFVVLFSLIVSVMNYTRSLTSSLNTTSGVLILDNPFGPISSPHLLEPMFRIARHFHIQLICLTHLGTAAVTSFFDMVYQLRFKSLPLSNVEVLESEAKQHMEHAYYLSEQLSLF
ncbi:MAG: hypothetical protein IKH27_12325 [Oscillospiraceae bacterium]|nr:hypothetical protein [Oscillospiraceae bacterium]